MDAKTKQLLAIGKELYQNGEYKKAEKALTVVLREAPGLADVHNMLGVVYHNQTRLSEAKECFERALQINPAYTEAALSLAVTCNDLGQYSDAKKIYGRTMEATHTQPRSLDPFAKGKLANMHADVGDAYVGIGFLAEASREYQCALNLCPTFVDIRTKLANTYRDMGNIDGAIEEYEEVEETNPNYVPGHLQFGVTLYAAKRQTDAISQWKKVLEIEPDNRSARFYLKLVVEE
ncbi:MAG: tetratricopeptide repeat protein [Pseudomonadota bacterium]